MVKKAGSVAVAQPWSHASPSRNILQLYPDTGESGETYDAEAFATMPQSGQLLIAEEYRE